MKVVGPESESKDKELTVDNIKLQERIATQFDKWRAKQKEEQEKCNNIARLVEGTLGFGRIDPQPSALFTDSGQAISE